MLLVSIFIFSVLGLAGSSERNKPIKQNRIIGGHPGESGLIPWIVSLQREKAEGKLKHFCAGSIVDSTHIVTAAHCLWNKTDVTITIIAGSLYISAIEEGQQRVNVSSVHLHPQYLSKNKAGPYDIAVLTLSTALTFNDRVAPIALPDPRNGPASGDCIYAGWGNRFLLTGLYYNPSDVLLTVRARIVSKFNCLIRYLFALRGQLNTALCTMAGPLRGSCQGDSGGSVTCYNKFDDTPYLAGVVSWGWFICGDGIHPDVATDVSLFTDFIKSFLVIHPEQIEQKLTNSTK